MPFGKKSSKSSKKNKKVDRNQTLISFNPFAASQSSQSTQATTPSLDPWSDEDETIPTPTLSSVYRRSMSSPSVSVYTSPESLMTPVVSDDEGEDFDDVDLRFTPALDSSPSYSHLTGFEPDSTSCTAIEFPISPWTEEIESDSPLAIPLFTPTTPPRLVSRQSSLESYLNRENVNRLVVSPARRIIFSRSFSTAARRLFEPMRDKLILCIILLLTYLFASHALGIQFRRVVRNSGLFPNQNMMDQVLTVVQEVLTPSPPITVHPGADEGIHDTHTPGATKEYLKY